MTEKLDTWIPVEFKLPEKAGWYKVKTLAGTETEIPYVSTLSGNYQWLTPTSVSITHWKER